MWSDSPKNIRLDGVIHYHTAVSAIPMLMKPCQTGKRLRKKQYCPYYELRLITADEDAGTVGQEAFFGDDYEAISIRRSDPERSRW